MAAAVGGRETSRSDDDVIFSRVCQLTALGGGWSLLSTIALYLVERRTISKNCYKIDPHLSEQLSCSQKDTKTGTRTLPTYAGHFMAFKVTVECTYCYKRYIVVQPSVHTVIVDVTGCRQPSLSSSTRTSYKWRLGWLHWHIQTGTHPDTHTHTPMHTHSPINTHTHTHIQYTRLVFVQLFSVAVVTQGWAGPPKLIDCLSCDFHSTQDRSFWKRSSQPISWLSTEKLKQTQQKETCSHNKIYNIK